MVGIAEGGVVLLRRVSSGELFIAQGVQVVSIY
jgi:hypothetical protein